MCQRFIPDEVLAEAEIPPEVKAQKKLVLATIRALLTAPTRAGHGSDR